MGQVLLKRLRDNRLRAISEPMLIGEATEDQCVVCRRWPKALRPAMRAAINSLPLKQPVCVECAVAFWTNIRRKAQRQRPG